MKSPFISVCIPAFRRAENIDRLIQSISIQTFKNYEIVITDDSPDECLRPVLQKYGHLPIAYFKNDKPLGTPANWNYAISLARGEWIKIMHDDDWFAQNDALQLFADATSQNKKFIVCRYVNVFNSAKTWQSRFPLSWKRKVVREPLVLLAENVIGPPSVTLVHSSISERYDTFMKWRVDIDFYVRLLRKGNDIHVIDRPLVNVGISESQVTNYCINKPEVELPEGLLLLNKYGVAPLQNIWVYDAWWRILRNLNIRTPKQLYAFTPYDRWPKSIVKMINHQAKIPPGVLKFGPVSKICMLSSFLRNRRSLNDDMIAKPEF